MIFRVTTIEDMLHRRNDLSTFIVHFTKADSVAGRTGFEQLQSIISAGAIEARTAYGAAAKHPQHAESQKVVCFTETPLEHTWTMLDDLAERRASKFEPFGLAFTKTYARRNGCNPVWYTDATRGNDWPINAINAAIQAERRPPSDKESMFRVAPFVEQMGTWASTRKEFWWEREWRHIGRFSFAPSNVVAVLAAEDHQGELREALSASPRWRNRDVPLLDPKWGLERMIATLSRVDTRDIGPFPG